MAKVILVGGPSFALFNPSLHASLGLLYLAASLRQAGHDVKIQDCHKLSEWDGEKLKVNPALLEPCDILGVSIVTPNAEFGGQLAAAWPATLKVAGGPHVTYIVEGPHARFKTPKYFEGFDFLMTGECEESFVWFCNRFDDSKLNGYAHPRRALEQAHIPGLVYFDALGMHANPQPPLPDVTKLPMPAYDLWENYSSGGLQVTSKTGKSVDAEERKIGSLWTARGCLVAGTMITLESGLDVAIESLRVGDIVKCFDVEKGVYVSAPVQATWERDADDLWELELDDGTKTQITTEHPIWTKKGWSTVQALKVSNDFVLCSMQTGFCGLGLSIQTQEDNSFLFHNMPLSIRQSTSREKRGPHGSYEDVKDSKVGTVGAPPNSYKAGPQTFIGLQEGQFESDEETRGGQKSINHNETKMGERTFLAYQATMGAWPYAYALATEQCGTSTECWGEVVGGNLERLWAWFSFCWEWPVLGWALRFWQTKKSRLCERESQKGDFAQWRALAFCGSGKEREARLQGVRLGCFDCVGATSEDTSPQRASQAVDRVWRKIVRKTFIGGAKVYNITVHPYHNYFANDILVHNCPYGCYFCADARTKLREETNAQIEAEVEALAGVGVTALRIWDDVLTIKDKHCRELADIFHNNGMLWRGWSRVNLMNPELFTYLEKRGCTEMGFGVEHGSARMLKAMNKGTTPDANEKGIKICQDAGITARAYLLIGFPGETWESIYEMRDWLDKVRPDAASLHMFQPYPGSQVWNTPERFGVTLPENAFSQMWELNDDDPKTLVLDLPTMSKTELFEARTMLHEWIQENISLRLANR